MQLPKIDIAQLNARRHSSKPSDNPLDTTSTRSEDAPEPVQVDKASEGRTLRRRKEKVDKPSWKDARSPGQRIPDNKTPTSNQPNGRIRSSKPSNSPNRLVGPSKPSNSPNGRVGPNEPSKLPICRVGPNTPPSSHSRSSLFCDRIGSN
ncbi:hypothetical protein DY000_02015972 [Brassica cretica]|uniref:Uncharacterized protein n=1 Tax=Brassica cretica TaxID=69181 RepID=A0ABQ7CLN6_BRACR|nr:hypothetical protein DY000_02015972 [Brassica cretica]